MPSSVVNSTVEVVDLERTAAAAFGASESRLEIVRSLRRAPALRRVERVAQAVADEVDAEHDDDDDEPGKQYEPPRVEDRRPGRR